MVLKLFTQGLVFLVFFTFIRCQNQDQNIDIKKNEVIQNNHNVLQNGRIISKPVVQPIPVDQIQPPELQQDDTNQEKPKYVARGDILIPIEEIERTNSKRAKRKIIAEKNYYGYSNRWPRGVIPYDFVSGIDYQVQQKVLTAIQHWHQHTCIRFEPYNQQRHWDIGAKITIDDSGSGCATYVGYRSASNGYASSYSVYLPPVCPLGSAIHELGHVIGYYHEMARTDRDQEIILYFNSMSSSEATQYDIMPNPMPGYYGQPYDLGSIMHYYVTNVMAARDSRRAFLMGQRVGLSFLDSKLANLGYHCSDKCNPKPVCENEGYVNQYCKCTCPDGFYGDRCNLLQGYLSTSRLLATETEPTPLVTVKKTQPPPPTTTTTAKTETSTKATVHWLEWSDWSNCSESCGSGVHVRTRLCSNTTIDGSSDPCSSLGGDSFEIESCQNSDCNQNDIILSCTFDLSDEKCPLQNQNDHRIQSGIQGDQIRPITDHTRGDGKYILIAGSSTELNTLQRFELVPFTHSKSTDENNHCLQLWYSTYGEGIIRITIAYNTTNGNQTTESFTINWKEQDMHWKEFQRTIPSDNDYKLIFEYESITTEYNHIALDDISITDGVCSSNKINNQRRRKRRQTSTACSSIIDLTTTRTTAIITSPNYPNLYPSSAQCYYYIRAPQSYRISLQFTDFNIPTSTANYCYDSVELRYYNLGQPGPKYCGSGANTNNLQFVSTKNYIMIVFQSDQNYAGRGFRAQAVLGR